MGEEIAPGTPVGFLQQTIDGYGVADRVRLLGFPEHLSDVYHSADIFLSTSDYEGCVNSGAAIAVRLTGPLTVSVASSY